MTNGTESNQPVLAMSWFGKLGRFGNQIFQYAFLKVCAKQSGAKTECPAWIGQLLFGCDDDPVSARLPMAVEQWDVAENVCDRLPELIPYLEAQGDGTSLRVKPDILSSGLANADLWGYFQVHTRHFKPHQDYVRSLFQPVEDLRVALEQGVARLQSKGKTIVGIHIRRGDFALYPILGFTLAVPTKWYYDWLKSIWHQLEEPVLFLCSDSLDQVIHDFQEFNPVTSLDLEVDLPARMQNAGIDFYIDFFMLTQCDVLCISNSVFSFSACMLNERAQRFIRPHWDFSTKFTQFDPWDSEPLLFIGDTHPRLFKRIRDIIETTYKTQGILALFQSILFYLPLNFIVLWLLRAYYGYQAKGMMGVLQTLR